MRQWSSSAAWCAAIFLFAPVGAFGHGGQYPGPRDTVPPNVGGGGDVTPPGIPPPPGTGGGVGPVTGGPGGRPTTGGGPGPVSGGGAGLRAGATGGVRRRGTSGGFDQWQFWWELNKARFLDLRERLAAGVVQTGSAAYLVGRVGRQAAATTRPTPEQVQARIVPALRAMLEEEDADQVDSAVLALARILGPDDAAEVLPDLLATVRHPAASARESATLALGVLGSRAAIPPLRDLLLDTPEGRRLNGRAEGVEDRVRAFAAAALGLIGDPVVTPDLLAVVRDRRIPSQADVKALAVAALGLLAGDGEATIGDLLHLLGDRNVARLVEAQVPIALGKRVERQAATPPAGADLVTARLVQALVDDKSDDQLRRSAANGLAMAAPMEHPAALESLAAAVQRDADPQTRFFALLALAQIGARDPAPPAHADAHRALEELLTEALVRPRTPTLRPYGALGLAIYARTADREGLRSRAVVALQETLADCHDPSHQAAMAVGLGLLQAREAAEDLTARFHDTHDPGLRGYLALALGMLRAPGLDEEFRAVIRTPGIDGKLRLQLARALGLLGDPEAVPALVAYLQDSETLWETSTAAQALGLIGDRGAVEPLLAVLADETRSALQKAFAAVALGILAERQDPSWNTVFAENVNYRAKVPALAEILDIL